MLHISANKKQSLILLKEELFTFLESDTNDDKKFLVRKAVSVMGYFGGLRCAELLALEFKDVAINNDCITVFIRSSKTDPHGKSKFYFTIPNKHSSDGRAYNIIKMYFDAVSNKTGRFFQNYNFKSKTFAGQPMGRNTIGATAKFIANYLGLADPDSYTGHCFRRSSATALADSGASLTMLKRQYRWKSDTVAHSYIDQSKHHKMEVANSLAVTCDKKITIPKNLPSEIENAVSKVVNINNCSNVIINL